MERRNILDSFNWGMLFYENRNGMFTCEVEFSFAASDDYCWLREVLLLFWFLLCRIKTHKMLKLISFAQMRHDSLQFDNKHSFTSDKQRGSCIKSTSFYFFLKWVSLVYLPMSWDNQHTRIIDWLVIFSFFFLLTTTMTTTTTATTKCLSLVVICERQISRHFVVLCLTNAYWWNLLTV